MGMSQTMPWMGASQPLMPLDDASSTSVHDLTVEFSRMYAQVDLTEDRSPRAIACAVITVFIASLFVGARFYTRIKIIPILGKEDWAILISLVFSIATSVCMISQCYFALGKHIPTISDENQMRFIQISWLTLVFYALSLWFTKAAILLLYIRILSYRWARLVSKAMLAAVVIFHIFIVASILTACVPIQKFWDPSVDGYCHPRGIWWSNTYGNIITDFLIFLIPLPIIFTMTLPIRQKIGLYFVFLIGFFVCMVSIIRMLFLMEVHTSFDPSFDNVIVAIWTCIELNTAIVCSCLATLKPFAATFFPRLILSNSKRNADPAAGAAGAAAQAGTKQLTIGSKPIRAIDWRLSEMSEFGSLSSMSEKDEEYGLEAQGGEKDDVAVARKVEIGPKQLSQLPQAYIPPRPDSYLSDLKSPAMKQGV